MELASRSGLDALVASLTKTGEFDDMLLFDLTCGDWGPNYRSLGTQDEAKDRAIAVASSHIVNSEEMRTLTRGLEIDPATDHWRHYIDNDQPTLFPCQKSENIASAITPDRFVLSGVVGAVLQRYKSRYPLLSRSRFEEYGFSNHMEACAFVGAYVLGQITATYRESLKDEMPGFVIPHDNEMLEIFVGGTMHGDFRLGARRTYNKAVISPAHSLVDFAPQETVWVAGYHSIETNIVVGLIVDEYTRGGKTKALELIGEMGNKISGLQKEADGLSFRTGPYADYGMNDDPHWTLAPLRHIVKTSGSTTRLMRKGKLYSAPYLPQLDHLFEIKHITDGVRFQGRGTEDPEPDDGIDIPREYYPDLFRALVVQAQMGLGRTSPQEHISILNAAYKLLCATS